jgi:fructose-1,6-bisphosphatase I
MTAALDGYLAERAAPELRPAIAALAEAAAGLAARLARPAPLPDPGGAFTAWLPGSGIRWAAIRGQGASNADAAGDLALALDPLQGCAGEGAAAGTLFALRAAATGEAEASFLTGGAAILAAGALVYGPRTSLALALGGEAARFTLDPATASFRLTAPELQIPPARFAFAANIAQYRAWDRPVRRYVDDCLAGAEGPRAADHDFRWTGCLAVELHRIVARGGLFLAPHGAPDLPDLVHQAQPLAFLAEAAGGRATDGKARILDRVPGALDSVSPLVFGAREPVDRVAAYHDLPDSEDAPLFGKRGLFRL